MLPFLESLIFRAGIPEDANLLFLLEKNTVFAVFTPDLERVMLWSRAGAGSFCQEVVDNIEQGFERVGS